jgi:hypothetical protein
MEYIQPTSGAEQNFGFGDLSYAELHLMGTLGNGGSNGPVSSPLALVPRVSPVASSNGFPLWIVVVAIGLLVLLSDR